MKFAIKFGVFDHLDASGEPLGEFYEERLRLVEAYDRAGLYAYHTAEHHATPLGMCPSPSVFHAAVAQRTQRLRFGPLVYILPLYHPLRLAEEICMLDHLSGGRFQLGVGRGISPIEVGYYGLEPQKTRAMYPEAFAVILKALNVQTLSFEGEFYSYRDVPIQMHPVQRPHPPLWYGIATAQSTEWCARNNVNVVSNAPLDFVRGITDQYRVEWAKLGHDPAHIPLMGTTRHMVIAPTDREAIEIGQRAYRLWYASFMYLWRKHNAMAQYAFFPETFDELMQREQAIVGSPATVRERLAHNVEASGINYLLCRFAFGDTSLEESMRSVELFAKEVMPAFA